MLKHNFSFVVLAVTLVGLAACRSRPHRAEDIKTELDRSGTVSGTQKVGLKDGDMVVMDKTAMSEKLRDLQNTVFALEDKVYGTRKLGSTGLYGDVKACKRKLASRQFGGSGALVWTEPLDRVTDKEADLKLGLDEKKELVGVDEEYLRDRLQRFQGYKMILQKRSDEFEDQLESCKTDLASKEMDATQSSKVMVSEAPKSTVDKAAINKFMCRYVKSGASLNQLMLNAFAHGWLSLTDYQLDQNITGSSLKDAKGRTKDNALLFSGWRLAYNRSPVTVNELLKDGQDAQLQAWAYDKSAEVEERSSCLKSPDGEWNN